MADRRKTVEKLTETGFSARMTTPLSEQLYKIFGAKGEKKQKRRKINSQRKIFASSFEQQNERCECLDNLR